MSILKPYAFPWQKYLEPSETFSKVEVITGVARPDLRWIPPPNSSEIVLSS